MPTAQARTTRTSGAPVSGTSTSQGASTSVSTATQTGGPGNAAAVDKLNGNGVSSWAKPEKEAIQRELKRLGLYTMGIDGDIGRGSKSGLVEAFGGDEWQTMAAADVLTRLQAATPVENKEGIRYGEMFKDGVLDITIGIGFDETGAHYSQIQAISEALADRGYEEDAVEGMTLLASTGRKVGGAGQYFVKRDALTFKPPAGEARSVHSVVRFVNSPDGKKGGEAAGAFEEGLQDSDVAMYGGHGRYGSGPDFDRNMSFELLDKDGNVVREIDDYTVLEDVLAEEGKPAGRSAWSVFQRRVADGTLKVTGSNDGNVFLNDANNHPGEFGSNLMFWNLSKSGKKLETGNAGKLAQPNADEEKYRLWVFDGCRTQDYVKNIRGTAGAGRSSEVGLYASTRTLYWSDIAASLVAFLDGVAGQQSGGNLTKALDSKQSEGPNAFKPF